MSTKNINQNLLSLFARHPKYLLRLLFTYYPISNEQIVKFKGEVKWGYLSSNTSRSWDQFFIEEYSDQLNWDTLSGNPSLPWSYEFITKYEKFWNFYSLPLNEGIPWTQELILHPKINYKNLSTVNGQNLWTEEFLLQNAAILP